MSPSIAEANAALRQAVEIRRENQAAGKPHEDWYGERVTKTLPERLEADDSLQAATRLSDEDLQQQIEDHHLHRAGMTQEELDAAIQRLSREAFPRSTVHPTSQAFFDLCDQIKAMHASKSRDYGCPSGTDPLANIRNGAKFVGIPAFKAAMVRLSDKVTRLATYNATGRLEFEGVEDTLMDLASYAMLSLVLLREENDG